MRDAPAAGQSQPGQAPFSGCWCRRRRERGGASPESGHGSAAFIFSACCRVSLPAARSRRPPYPVAEGGFCSSSPPGGRDVGKTLWGLRRQKYRGFKSGGARGVSWRGGTKPEMLCPPWEAALPIIKLKMSAGFLRTVLLFACLSSRAQESSESTFPFWLAEVSLSACRRPPAGSARRRGLRRAGETKETT